MNRLNKTFTRWLCLVAAGFLGLATSVSGQGVTSAALNGMVTGPNGSPVPGATVRVVHMPSGTSYRAITGASGTFGVTGLRVGGPYRITASSNLHATTSVEDVFTELGRSNFVEISMAASEALAELDEFTITGDAINTLMSSTRAGSSSTLTNEAVENNPQFRRSLNDFARFNPYASITEDDRNELTVAGQNNRFNNIQIDGIRTNDQFGLNSNGVASFNNPVASDAIEQITVEVSPYDVRQSGFTGATINAVTKSGSNELSGSVYTYYTDDSFRGPIVTSGSNDLFREWTWGATLGGPILRDRLFFFVSYEEFKRTEEPAAPGMTPDSAALQQVLEYGRNTLGVDFGSFAPPTAFVEDDEKILAKLDWNITMDHRLSASYRRTKGQSPNFGRFGNFNATALDTNFYAQLRDENNYAFELFSNWSPDFQTEVRVSFSEFRQPTTFRSALPEIDIINFPRAGGGTGTLWMGTERFRHANNLDWDTFQLAAIGTYYVNDFKLTFGFDTEQSDFANLFLESSFGRFSFNGLDNFLNDVPRFDGTRFTRVDGQSPIADPKITVSGAFVQNEWMVNPRLTLTGGLRLDWISMNKRPPVAQGFQEAFGFPNNGSIDGERLLAPRFSFNYALNPERTLQLRGGIGLFLGRSPAVWIANAFTNNGETSGALSLSDGLVSYMQNNFDPNNPIVSIPREQSTPGVDVVEEGLKLPSVWRYNVAVDWEMPWWDLVATTEVMITDVEHALWVQDANRTVSGTGPDGRELYQRRGVTNAFQDVYVLRNSTDGKAENFSIQIQKPYRGDGFFGSFSWTWGRSKDINPFTSSRAVSNWNNRAGFDFNQPEVATSNFEVRNRFLGVFGYSKEWREGYRTTATLAYEGRAGRPYSYVFNNDVNSDGRFRNDLFYVPTGPGDPLVSFAANFPVNEFFSYLDQTGLSRFAGGPAPRNAFNNPWVHTWDLKVVQELPIWDRVRSEIFFDFKNIGNWIDRDWGLVEEAGFPFVLGVADANIEGGRYAFTNFNPQERSIQSGNFRSRWLFQVGAKIKW